MLISVPMNNCVFSVRMRASCQDRHLSGAERLVVESDAGAVLAELSLRALNCPGGPPDTVHCHLERIDATTVQYERLPDLSTYHVKDWQEGRRAARALLVRSGVRQAVAACAIDLLATGAAGPGTVMRGAVLMDAKSGDRLETDAVRGVRVSRMDMTAKCRSGLKEQLAMLGLSHPRILEAMVLSGKVLRAPGLIAELCWSDARDYTTGYVADPENGYQRISTLKPVGDPLGGRVFFVDRGVCLLEELVDYLERQAVLFDTSGSISSTRQWVSNDA